jgi:hypothetical protein
MERISVTIFFCVALIVGIILQAPPQVYQNVSGYYQRFGKGSAPVQKPTNATTTPKKKKSQKKPSKPRDEGIAAASFAPDSESLDPDRK